jgi:hypothetical protein
LSFEIPSFKIPIALVSSIISISFSYTVLFGGVLPMADLQEMLEHINKLRCILYKLIEESQENLQDDAVLSTSRILNSDIAEYSRLRYKS